MSPPTTFAERPLASTDAEAWVAGRHRIVGLSLLAREEGEQWRSKLTTLASDCGCGVGAALALLAIAIYLAAVALAPQFVKGSIPIGVGVFLAGAGLGKFVGIWRARRLLDRSVDELKRRITLSRYAM